MRRVEGLKKGVKKITQKLELLPNKTRNMMVKLGGGEKKVIELRQTSPELMKARYGLEAARQSEKALVGRSTKWKNPGSARNQKRLSDATNLTAGARENLTRTKEQVTQDALRRVRNRGIKRLSTVGTLGALGLGTYNAFSGSPASTNVAEGTPQQYRYNPNNGWQEWNQETGQYENQQQGFGIDRYGNTNYYDGTNWLTPDQYLQGSNGYIYDKQTGQIIGTADDTMEAHNSGYDSVFDYRAAKAGYNSPEAVKQLQEKLGINADGKWGQQTQDAFNKTVSNWAQQYDPNSLFSIYQRKMQFGY